MLLSNVLLLTYYACMLGLNPYEFLVYIKNGCIALTQSVNIPIEIESQASEEKYEAYQEKEYYQPYTVLSRSA
jgi:hypothetical protein